MLKTNTEKSSVNSLTFTSSPEQEEHQEEMGLALLWVHSLSRLARRADWHRSFSEAVLWYNLSIEDVRSLRWLSDSWKV